MSLTDQNIVLVNGTGLESLVGQFQEENENILCVRDGRRITIYKDQSDIPRGLIFTKSTKVSSTGIIEYYFQKGPSVYTFFNKQVYKWLTNGRTGDITLPASSKRDVTVEAPVLDTGHTDATVDYLSSEWTVAEAPPTTSKNHIFKVKDPPSDRKYPVSTSIHEEDADSLSDLKSAMDSTQSEEMTGKTLDIDFYDLPMSGSTKDLAIYRKA